MRILLASDLHCEFERLGGPPAPSHEYLDLVKLRRDTSGHPPYGPDLTGYTDIDLVLLAGDIDVKSHGFSYATMVSEYLNAPVCYVAGNHEFYQSDYLQEIDNLNLKSTDRVRYLQNKNFG